MSVKAIIKAARPNSCNNDDKVVFTVHPPFLTAGYVLTTTDCAVEITEEVLAFARNIAMHLETWLDFPLDEEEDLGDFDMSDAQQEHATRKDGCAGGDDDGGEREPEESKGEGPTLQRPHRRDHSESAEVIKLLQSFIEQLFQFHRLLVVMRLLKHRYTVRTTMHDPTNQKKGEAPAGLAEGEDAPNAVEGRLGG
ncbi:hypothetical protein ACFX13_038928 [Malus domestica]